MSRTPTRPSWRRRALLAALLLPLALVLGGEFLYYFPLTPLQLDLEGRTRLPASPDALRLLLVGDILIGEDAEPLIRRHGYDYPLAALAPLVRSADLAIGNLEGPISSAPARPGVRWSYAMHPEAARALARAGFDLLDLANNHLLDRGSGGVGETIQGLAQARLVSFGAGASDAEAHRPAWRFLRGVQLAFLGYLAPEQMLEGARSSLAHLGAGPRQAGVAIAEPARMARELRAAHAHADLVVAVLHLGDRYQSGPTELERRLCREAIEAGADVVVGHGPHVLGPLELHRGKPILYSVGNFAFGSNNLRARFSLLAFLDVDLKSRRLRELQLLPIYTVNANPFVRYQPKLLRGVQARRALEGILRASSAGGSWLERAEGPTRLRARF